MSEVLAGLGLILVLGTASMAIAYRLGMPSILLLLGSGLLVGPVLGWLEPDKLLGSALPTLVSVGVAVLLFEGGLGLDVRALAGQRRVVTRLVTVGVLVTWTVGALASYFFLDFSPRAALLLGAILVVSGPTVVLPLLRLVRPGKSLDAVLRWEGIVVDPIGALLALLVFEAAFGGELGLGTLRALGLSLGVGGAIGVGAAFAFVYLERRYWIADHLVAAAGLAFVVGVFTLSDLVQEESGLFAVTIMGIAMANQRKVSIRHILDFKESLSMILLGSLFVILAARVEWEQLRLLDWGAAALVAVLIVVARPLAVWVSTLRTTMPRNERLFLAVMAPRGIVAAAVAAFFALRLEEIGAPEAALFVPVTFLVIVVTVALYGLSARRVAVGLGVAMPNPQGVLFIGANPVSRALAKALGDEGFRTVLVDTNGEAVTAARLEGLEAMKGNILSVRLSDELDVTGIGRLWAVTPNDETNSLACTHFAKWFNRVHVYQVADPTEDETERHEHLRGRILFGAEHTYRRLRDRFASDAWSLRRTALTETFGFDEYAARYADGFVPLFTVQNGTIRVFTEDHTPPLEPGVTVVALVRAPAKDVATAASEE